MSFFSKIKSSFGDIQQAVTQQVAGLNLGGSQGQQQPTAGGAPANGQVAHHQQQGVVFVQPAPANNAPFVGPFLKFVNTDLAANVNRYSILVVVKPGSDQAPFLRISAGGATSAPLLLDSYAEHRFWRIEVAVPLQTQAQAVKYSVNYAPDVVFYIPGRDEPYKWLFTSCNGFSSDVTPDVQATLNGIAPLWADVHRDHARQPFHAQMGGGDQLYCDLVWNSSTLKPWVENPSKEYKSTAPYTKEMNEEVHRFYFNEYMTHFQKDGFREALAAIPYNFIWDDHDVFDGWGSYPDYLQQSPVFQNMFVAAQRFYLLFQHHTNLQHARRDGYLGKHGHSAVRQYGPYMAFVSVDVRTERDLKTIVSRESWDAIFAAMDNLAPSTRHVVFGATIPLAYPRIPAEGAVEFAGTALNAVAGAIDSLSSFVGAGPKQGGRSELVKAMQKSSAYSGILNSLGEPELLDDLNDHWTATEHIAERDEAIQRFQSFAQRRGNVRVSFLSGDVHCCGTGKLYSADEALRSTPERDFRLMYQVVCSAIGNIPPPAMVISSLNKFSTEIALNSTTKENMHPIFSEDLAGQPTDQPYLMGARNWCRVTAPHAQPDALLFEINVEKVQGDPKGETKCYGVMVPALRA